MVVVGSMIVVWLQSAFNEFVFDIVMFCEGSDWFVWEKL